MKFKVRELKVNITKEFLYSKISAYDIYRFYIGDFKVNSIFKSPLREDRNSSFGINMRPDGELRYKDFAYPAINGDCFSFVMQKYGIDLNQAFNKIANDFGITGTTKDYQESLSYYKKEKVVYHSFIQIESKEFTSKDLEYWLQYGITKGQLVHDNVYSVKELCIDRQRFPIKKDELVFAYKYDLGFKIYLPCREKGLKWKSNIPTSYIEGDKYLHLYDKVIITKSKKDRLVLTNLLPNYCIINVQNESNSAFTQSFIDRLEGKDVWINFDSDNAGKTSSIALTSKYKFKHINVPDELYPIKDFSDWYETSGEETIIEYLKSKNIITNK